MTTDTDRLIIAFVQGACWWHVVQNEATPYSLEIAMMQAEAARRAAIGILGETIAEAEKRLLALKKD